MAHGVVLSIDTVFVGTKSDTDNITYFVPNIYAADERMIYFFSDAPHLVKTVRNAL